WSLGSLPMIPPKFGIKLMGERSKERQFNIIKKLIEGADCIINCGDAGQEGELIQRWIMQKAQAKCPVKRLWVSSLTEEAIKEGFATLKDQTEYQPLYEAGLCRAIGDWLLGMNATRLYTLKYGANKQVLSIGRVQTPTLALIVKRQHEIKNFVPKPYWELKTKYREVTFAVTEGKFDEKEKAEEALQKISGEPFTVTDISAKKGNELPPRLYDLTSLQVDCNKKYGMTSDVTLQTIQSLYEKKYTTYPRVDTTFLSEDIYPKCENILKGMRDYAPLVAPLMGKPLVKSKKVFDNKKVTDHHAIIPTGVHPQALTENEKRVYNLVATHFIAIFYPECKFSTTTVLGESGGVKFKATGKQITDPGWRVVFAKEAVEEDNKEEKNEQMPAFVKGESGPHTPDLAEKLTQPPKPYTEATLLRAMETAGKNVEDEELRDLMKENGIGRPSTRAEIIKTLFKRNYIRNEKKNIIATETGIELVGLIRNELLKSAELTGQWEKKLRDIERKNYEAKQFIAELKEMLIQVVNSVLSDNTAMKA
ncbi:MAG: DNA topoisomerase III, partial [Bacteroidaceae bacterium]|nr:DNA topoisomerase III [Bacteroidaceae bacterium]